jgi:HlyD family secretion protein
MVFKRTGAHLLFAVLLGLSAGCSKSDNAAEPIVSVQVAPARQESISRIIHCEGILFPLQQAAITAKVNAPVKRFYVNRGSRVKAGQLLATLENKDLAASAIENKGALAQAQAAYATTTAAGVPEEMQKAESDAEAARQVFDAEQKLFDSRQNLYQQGALPRKDLDQARVSLTQAKSQYELAQQHWNALQAGGKEQALKSASGQLQSAEGKYQGAEAQLSYSQILSPIRGVVTERSLHPGEMAAAGSPLLTVMDTSSVIAKAHVPQEDAAQLKAGAEVQLTIPGGDDKVPARITMVSPATDVNSTTVEIWAQAANPDNLLRPGTTVQLAIVAQKIEGALVVPSSAVLKQPEGSSAVMVAGPDNKAHLQAIQPGIQNGDDVQVISGLKAGQNVITNGGYGLPDNTEIKIDSSPSGSSKSD